MTESFLFVYKNTNPQSNVGVKIKELVSNLSAHSILFNQQIKCMQHFRSCHKPLFARLVMYSLLLNKLSKNDQFSSLLHFNKSCQSAYLH